MPKQAKKKKKELTPYERLQKAIKEGKVLAAPMLEGETEAKDEKVYATRMKHVAGYLQVGVAQGLTFSESQDRVSNWHRIDHWIVAHVHPNYLDEVRQILDDYVVDKIATKYEALMDALEAEDDQ
jgi:VanZ family protein